jgi:succinoglycan biosynthesis transport protein ExoP
MPVFRYPLQRPNSAYAEAVQSINTAMFLAGAASGHSPRSVVVTSAVASEGKTSLSLAWGMVAAKGGQRVLLVEADLRRPRIKELFGLNKAKQGLEAVVMGEIEPNAAVYVEETSGLRILPAAGDREVGPAEFLKSKEFSDFLFAARDLYELIIVDAPPIMIVSDAALISAYTDACLFVVQWEKTRRELVTAGLARMRVAGAKVLGIALAQVHLRRHAQYGHFDTATQYTAYSSYYRP